MQDPRRKGYSTVNTSTEKSSNPSNNRLYLLLKDATDSRITASTLAKINGMMKRSRVLLVLSPGPSF